MDLGVPKISAILILDGNGKRIAVKYYTDKIDQKTQPTFERKLFQKTQKSASRVNADILLHGGHLVLFKHITESGGLGVHYYVLADAGENELVVFTVLSALEEVITSLLRNQVNRKTMVENLDLVLLAVDELVDDGMILETDPEVISARVQMRSGNEKEVPFAEQTLAEAISSARTQLISSWR